MIFFPTFFWKAKLFLTMMNQLHFSFWFKVLKVNKIVIDLVTPFTKPPPSIWNCVLGKTSVTMFFCSVKYLGEKFKDLLVEHLGLLEVGNSLAYLFPILFWGKVVYTPKQLYILYTLYILCILCILYTLYTLYILYTLYTLHTLYTLYTL